MKRFLDWLIDGYHWVHAAWGMLIPLCAAYIFFTAPDMNWKIDAITAIIFAPLVAIGVLLYQFMFRKKSVVPRLSDDSMEAQPTDPIQQDRRSRRRHRQRTHHRARQEARRHRRALA
jgi:hypothetical protein